ncbi:hypothetical protein LTR62_003157 [Meristemomyces frigidus]|uniref:Uncharacterized protein n=1 Tax=Meristemomyces frigidus TaxID=1508187 RepID=A0AAN7YH73_9PEZI|nr:hypothetical protein LTR62_003157 [Meristemomyces frigidus]
MQTLRTINGKWEELTVAGRIIDTVVHTLSPFSVYQSTQSLDVDFRRSSAYLPWEATTLDAFLNELADLGIIGSREGLTKALLRSLFMDGVQWAALTALGQSLYREGPIIRGATHHEKMDKVISILTGSPNVDYEHLPHECTLKSLHELSKIQYWRRVVYCRQGNLALAPDRVERGDKIAILHGARVPFLLRYQAGGKLTMIGQCYYDGAMYGEISDALDSRADMFTLV